MLVLAEIEDMGNTIIRWYVNPDEIISVKTERTGDAIDDFVLYYSLRNDPGRYYSAFGSHALDVLQACGVFEGH